MQHALDLYHRNHHIRQRRQTIAMTSICALAFIVVLTTVACIHKTGSAVTPWERVHTYNASIAELNDTLEQGVEAANTSNVLSQPQAYSVINWCGQVAVAHKQITAILAQGQNVKASDMSTIQALLAQINLAGQTLVSSGAFGIKNPKSQNLISADIQAVIGMAENLTTALAQLLTNPAPSNTPPPPAVKPTSFHGNFIALLFASIGFPMAAIVANPAFWEEIVSLIVQIGPLGVALFGKLEGLMHLGPDEATNIANAIVASNNADDDTIAHVTAWMAAKGLKPTFQLSAGSAVLPGAPSSVIEVQAPATPPDPAP